MNKIISNAFTEKDNQTYDIVRIVYFLACMVLFICQLYRVLYWHDFNFSEFGLTYGSITTVAAGALVIKRKTEAGES